MRWQPNKFSFARWKKINFQKTRNEFYVFVVKHHRYCHLCHAILPCVLGPMSRQGVTRPIWNVSVIATELGRREIEFHITKRIDTIQFGHRIEIRISQICFPFDVRPWEFFISSRKFWLSRTMSPLSGFLFLYFLYPSSECCVTHKQKVASKAKGRHDRIL